MAAEKTPAPDLIKPAKKMLDDLYAKGLLDKSKFFDERLEVEYYELWHHEGRRARMGAAMMKKRTITVIEVMTSKVI